MMPYFEKLEYENYISLGVREYYDLNSGIINDTSEKIKIT